MAKKQKPQPITGFTFELFGDEWKVEIRQGPIFADAKDPVSGYCEPDKRLIVLEEHPDREFLRRVLLHEIGHAAMAHFSTHGIGGKTGWVPEESAVEAIAQAMTQLVRQSFVIPSWVFGKTKV